MDESQAPRCRNIWQKPTGSPTIRKDDPYISTSALADVMHVSAPAVTRMVQRLKEAGYLEHEPYRGVFLTPAGEREALMSIRRHRLVEVFLVKVMKFGWHEVHDQADELGVVDQR